MSVKGFLKIQDEGPNDRLNFVKAHGNGSLTHLPGLAELAARLQQSLEMNVPAVWPQGWFLDRFSHLEDQEGQVTFQPWFSEGVTVNKIFVHFSLMRPP